MAYMNQLLKASLSPAIKAICKKYGVKATLSVRHHCTLIINIKAGKIDFNGNYKEVAERDTYKHAFIRRSEAQRYDGYHVVNHFHYQRYYDGVAREFLSEVIPAMNVGNYNRSDVQSDYSDVGWYIEVKVGNRNKPYELLA